MSWEMHEAAKKIADGWYLELETTRKRNAVLGRENAKLREERDTYRDLVGCMVHSDIPDQLEAENAKLRELARRFGEYVSQDHCEGCVMKRRCNNGDVEECWQMTEIRALANELGVEVDG